MVICHVGNGKRGYIDSFSHQTKPAFTKNLLFHVFCKARYYYATLFLFILIEVLKVKSLFCSGNQVSVFGRFQFETFLYAEFSLGFRQSLSLLTERKKGSGYENVSLFSFILALFSSFVLLLSWYPIYRTISAKGLKHFT